MTCGLRLMVDLAPRAAVCSVCSREKELGSRTELALAAWGGMW